MRQLENYGVQELNANETVNIDGGYETYPGGCSYSGGGMQYGGPTYGPNRVTLEDVFDDVLFYYERTL